MSSHADEKHVVGRHATRHPIDALCPIGTWQRRSCTCHARRVERHGPRSKRRLGMDVDTPRTGREGRVKDMDGRRHGPVCKHGEEARVGRTEPQTTMHRGLVQLATCDRYRRLVHIPYSPPCAQQGTDHVSVLRLPCSCALCFIVLCGMGTQSDGLME